MSSDYSNGNTAVATATVAKNSSGGAGLGDPEEWRSGSGSGSGSSSGSDNVTAAAPPSSSSCVEDWDYTMLFPNAAAGGGGGGGDGGLLLPWLIEDAQNAASLGFSFKQQQQQQQLLHSDGFPFPFPESQHQQQQQQQHPMSACSEFGKIFSNDSNGNGNGNGNDNSSSSMIMGALGPPQSQSQSQSQFENMSGDEKPQILDPQLVINPHQAQVLANPAAFFVPPFGCCPLEPPLLQPPPKRHNPGVGVVLDPTALHLPNNSFMDQGHKDLLSFAKHNLQHQQQQQQQQQHLPGFPQLPMGAQLVPPKPIMAAKHNHHPQQQQQQQQQHFPMQLQEQAIKDLLFNAADHILTGNFSLAQEILARLNHQLSLPAKPLFRAALYVKEALQMLLIMGNPVAAPPSKTTALTPYDVVHKMNAYKVFSEVSPFFQFMNFTCTQAVLEALDDADAIHIVDFDIGCGAQWASLIQELPLRKRGAPSLKITAFVPLSTTHHFELALIHDNLVQFANDIGVAFELQVANLDSFDPSSCSMPNLRSSEDEAIAVCMPIWASSDRPSVLPPILEFIKQCSPKIVVSLDRGFDRCDVPFPQHLVHTLDSCTNFLESLDGLNATSDIVTKVEKFFVQPRIENTILGRVHFPEKMPHWKNLFASAGFSPVQFSNFTETQADYVVKRTPGRGFHVEKRQASLVLSWLRRELVAASAWRC